MNLNHFLLIISISLSTFLYSQERTTVKIFNNTFSSSFLLEANSTKNILLDINIYNIENLVLIKEIKLEITPINRYYKIDLSILPKNSDYRIIIREKENELLNELISNK